MIHGVPAVEERQVAPPVLLECGYYDVEQVEGITQALLVTLGTACVEKTAGDPFSQPAAVVPDVKKEMLEYLHSQSESYASGSGVVSSQGMHQVRASLRGWMLRFVLWHMKWLKHCWTFGWAITTTLSKLVFTSDFVLFWFKLGLAILTDGYLVDGNSILKLFGISSLSWVNNVICPACLQSQICWCRCGFWYQDAYQNY